MGNDVEVTSKQSIDSLHYRNNGRIYETRTPDGEPAVALQQQLAGEQTSLSPLWNEADTHRKKEAKGKGRAITVADDKREDIASPPASSRSSIASDEDDELLPSFGGEQDYDRPVSSYNQRKSTSNSRASLGLHQNGFISRDDMLPHHGSDNNDYDDQGALSNHNEKKYEDSSKSRKKKRKSKDRYNAGRFAKEMAFVVSF